MRGNYVDVIGRDLAYQCRAMRAERGWSQKELAARAGVSVATVTKVEGGAFNGALSPLLKIAAAFDVALEARMVPAPPLPAVPAPWAAPVPPKEQTE